MFILVSVFEGNALGVVSGSMKCISFPRFVCSKWQLFEVFRHKEIRQWDPFLCKSAFMMKINQSINQSSTN